MINLVPFSSNQYQIEVSAEVKFEKTKSVKNNRLVIVSGHFKVRDPFGHILWPSNESQSTTIDRKNEIWKTTCFEFFVKNESSDSYLEFNVNSVGAWNCYRFESYRHPQPPAPEADANLKSFKFNSDEKKISFELEIILVNPDLINIFSSQEIFYSLTAVMETKHNERVFMANLHTGDKPDFHRGAGFNLRSTISEL